MNFRHRVFVLTDKFLHMNTSAISGLENEFRFPIGGNISPMRDSSTDNYLKSPEEIEAEFCYVINTRQSLYPELDNVMEIQGRLKITTDGYMNSPELENAFSGPMEENY